VLVATVPAVSAPGLSTAHIGRRGTAKPFGIVATHRGGTLSSVGFGGLHPQSRANAGGGVRGAVTGFSAASRRRLLRKLAAVNKLAARRTPLFLTLTYPGEWNADPAVWKRNLRALLKRITARYGPHAVLWRMEFQKRGAPHFHLLVWDLQDFSGFPAWLSHAWYEVVGSGDERHLRAGTGVEKARTWAGASAYLSKYVAKLDPNEPAPPEHAGRVWGVEHRELLPTEPLSWVVTIKEALAFRRVLKRVSRARQPRRAGIQGLTAFLSDDAVEGYLRALVPNATYRGEWGDPAVSVLDEYL
jgi:hypothetical protein